MFFEERLYEIEFYSIKTLLHKVLFNLFRLLRIWKVINEKNHLIKRWFLKLF
jgi:hypothetical protein